MYTVLDISPQLLLLPLLSSDGSEKGLTFLMLTIIQIITEIPTKAYCTDVPNSQGINSAETKSEVDSWLQVMFI